MYVLISLAQRIKGILPFLATLSAWTWIFMLHLGIIFLFFSVIVPFHEHRWFKGQHCGSFHPVPPLFSTQAKSLFGVTTIMTRVKNIWGIKHLSTFVKTGSQIGVVTSRKSYQSWHVRNATEHTRSDQRSLTGTTGAQALTEAQTQGVQPGNEVAGLRSHASQAVIGTTLCSLKPRPSEQLIVTLSGFHDNCHAYRQYGSKKKINK